MSRKKVGVFCLFLFFTFFIIVPKVEATEEMKTKFTVTPVLPENQVSGTSSYYDFNSGTKAIFHYCLRHKK